MALDRLIKCGAHGASGRKAALGIGRERSVEYGRKRRRDRRIDLPDGNGGVTEDDDDPSRPDIGVLHLDREIALDAYAQPTDVTQRIGAGKPVQALDVVRYDQEPESPLHETNPMAVSSDVDNGYPYGITTPMFSKGGDSGSGLFEVVAGKRTHRLVGIARQPEPDKNLDHFTRVDAAFLAWLADQ